MREPQDTTIAGRLYRVEPLPTGRGLAMLTMLTKAVGRGLENVGSLADVEKLIGSAIADFLDRLQESDVERLTRTLCETTMVEKTAGLGNLVPLKDVYELHFAGAYGELAEWVAFGLKVNYGDFLDAIKAKLLARKAAAPAASAPPAAPAG